MKGTADKNLKGVLLVAADAHAAAPVSYKTAIDCQGFGELLAILDISDVGSPAGTATVKLQESATGVTSPDSFTDITGATFGALNTTGLRVGRVNLEARKRYIRAAVTVATSTMDLGATAVLAPNKDLPVTQVNSAVFSV